MPRTLKSTMNNPRRNHDLRMWRNTRPSHLGRNARQSDARLGCAISGPAMGAPIAPTHTQVVHLRLSEKSRLAGKRM